MRVAITGAAGMLGSSIGRAWSARRPDDEVLLLSRATIDLRDRARVRDLFESERPDLVVHAAAVVGGIGAKIADPAPYLLENVAIDSSVFAGALSASVPALIYIGSAAAYPEHAPQPLQPAALLDGRFESANEGYGLAKSVGMKLCDYLARTRGLAYRALVPSNLYGPGDRFDLETGHLIAATLRKVHDAHAGGHDHVVIWGDGRSRREFVFAPDLAAWIADQAERVTTWPSILNVGAGQDWTIDRFYELAAEVVGFRGDFVHDLAKPNGTRRRLLDSTSAASFGWAPQTTLLDGIRQCYSSLLDTMDGLA